MFLSLPSVLLCHSCLPHANSYGFFKFNLFRLNLFAFVHPRPAIKKASWAAIEKFKGGEDATL